MSMLRLLLPITLCILLLNPSVSQPTAVNPDAVSIFGDVGTGVYSINDVLFIVVTWSTEFDEIASVCQPTLILNTLKPAGGVATYIDRQTFIENVAGYEDAVSNADSVFSYTIPSGVNVQKLDIGSLNYTKHVALNMSGCNSTNFEFFPDLSGLELTPTVSISTKPPTVLSLATRLNKENVSVGDVVDILVSFSSGVYVEPQDEENLPQLILNSGGIGNYSGAAFGGDLTTIVFRYFVDYGETTNALDAANNQSLVLNGGVIYDAVNGMLAEITLPTGRSVGSLAATRRVRVVQIGQKFPPFAYDSDAAPEPDPSFTVQSTVHQAMSLEYSRLAGADLFPDQLKAHSFAFNSRVASGSSAVAVGLIIQVNSVFQLDEKAQTFKADILTVQSWTDKRFNVPELAAVTENSTSILSKIWYPQLTFVNAREKPSPFDTKVLTFNTGRVELWQRYISTFNSPVDARLFPFDTQLLQITVRSSVYNNQKVTFLPFNSAVQEEWLINLDNSQFSFSGYSQKLDSITLGLYSGFDTLTTSFKAKRIATFNAINILTPLSLLCLFCCGTFAFPEKVPSRVSLPVTCLAATLGFSIVLAQYSPPVDYMTRMTYFIFLTYIIAFVTLWVQIVLAQIRDGTKAVDDDTKKRKAAGKKKKETAWKKGVDKQIGDLSAAKKVEGKADPDEKKESGNTEDAADKPKKKKTKKAEKADDSEPKKDEPKKEGTEDKEKAAEEEDDDLKGPPLEVAHYCGLLKINQDNVDVWDKRWDFVNALFGWTAFFSFIIFAGVIIGVR